MPSKSEIYTFPSGATVFPLSRRIADFIALTKPRINLLVGVATLAGFYLAHSGGFNLIRLIHTLVGTVLVGSGASVLNQVWEWRTDAVMDRTRNRPICAGRIQAREGALFGVTLTGSGSLYLFTLVNATAASIATSSALLYVLVYTPLKSRTVLSTVVGAIPGGLPTLIGWTAAGGILDAKAMSLFATLFLWQLPHFLAISWTHREDYARAGIVNLAVLDPLGRLCSRQAFLYSLLLLPVSLTPTWVRLTGQTYFCFALLSGFVFVGYCCHFLMNRTYRSARRLFWYSILYLPLLYIVMMLDRL